MDRNLDDSVNTEVGILPYIIFMSVSFAVVYLSLFCGEKGRAAFEWTAKWILRLVEDLTQTYQGHFRTVGNLEGANVATKIAVETKGYVATSLFGVFLFVYFFVNP